jgi:hypothetical protein
MRKSWCAVFVMGLLMATVSAVRSGSPAEPRAIIDRAIQALGGEANLSKQKAATLKGQGTYYGADPPIDYTGEWAVQLPGQLRFTAESKTEGQAFRMTLVINNDKGWFKFNDQPAMEMNKERLAEERERLYSEWISTLLPLKDRAFRLASLGDAKVEGRDATGVRVSRQSHRDVSLYFDKANGLLLKTETTIKDIEKGGDTEMKQELIQSNFKEIDRVRHAMKHVLMRDGKRFVDAEFSMIRPLEKLDPGVFAQP